MLLPKTLGSIICLTTTTNAYKTNKANPKSNYNNKVPYCPRNRIVPGPNIGNISHRPTSIPIVEHILHLEDINQ